jgi:hypothetical protein
MLENVRNLKSVFFYFAVDRNPSSEQWGHGILSAAHYGREVLHVMSKSRVYVDIAGGVGVTSTDRAVCMDLDI